MLSRVDSILGPIAAPITSRIQKTLIQSITPPRRNMFPKAGRSIPRLRNERQSAYAERIAEVLRRELGDSHRAHKTLMRWTGANERTAKNWLSGVNGPSGEHLLRLMRCSNQVFECVLVLSDRQPILSRRKLEELLKALSDTTEVLADAILSNDNPPTH
jgi:hypothetical protein